MKRAIIIQIMLIFSISFCMGQLKQQIENQKQQEAQEKQVIQEQKEREQKAKQAQQQFEAEQRKAAAEEQRQRQAMQPSISVTSEGTLIRGSNLSAKLDWLDRSAESHNTYIIEVNANESISPRTLQYKGAINITVILRGDSENRTIRLSSHGTMFTVNQNVTFVLDNNITLQGHNQNTGSMVNLNGGTLKMNNGATITGNIRSATNSGGGGVHVASGTFTMNGGAITDNTANQGGGVYVNGGFGGSGTFIMNGGVISGNEASLGGGVEVSGVFTMNNGTISGNYASNQGGGVYVTRNFTMNGGIITDNIAATNGGGLYLQARISSFTKTGGTITGFNSDQSSGNKVADNNGIIARRGHAVYANENMRKETTAGPGMNLSDNNTDNWGDSASPSAPTRSTTRTTSSEPAIAGDEPALLHLYRKRRALDLLPKRYDILLDNMVVGVSTNNWKTTVTVNTFGTKAVSATIEGRKAEVRINFQPGGEYYVRSEVSSRTVDTGKTQTIRNRNGTTTTSKVTEIEYTPILQLVDKSIGQSELNAIVIK